MTKRTPPRKLVSPTGHLGGAVLSHMRQVAYQDNRIEAMNIMRRADRLRDDQQMLSAAEEKRLRKQQKRLAASKKVQP